VTDTTTDAYVPVDLSGVFDNDAISFGRRPGDGGFNVWGNTFPAEWLPEGGSLVEVGGVPFRFPPTADEEANNVVCDGQLIEVGPGRFDWIHVLAAAERRAEDWAYLHFADGSVDPEWLRVSDFWPGPGPRFGEVEAFRCPVMHYPHHVQPNLGPVMWRQRIPVTRQRPLRAIRLPENRAIHVFAMTLATTPDA
jgi:hypothetical protein